MHSVTEFLIHYGYAALFAAILSEQIGLPVPATPFLIAASRVQRWTRSSRSAATLTNRWRPYLLRTTKNFNVVSCSASTTSNSIKN
jgi:hypothetical protein